MQTAPTTAAPAAPPPPPAAPSGSAGGGPLPALPSQAPQYAQSGAPAEEAPPPETQWVQASPSGQWVYTTDYGWIWVPAGTATTDADGVPYAYIYTPTYGWTWYVSPWGWGPYHYGVWVSHPWHPVGWRGGFAAHPHVVVRLGGHAGGFRHGGRR